MYTGMTVVRDSIYASRSFLKCPRLRQDKWTFVSKRNIFTGWTKHLCISVLRGNIEAILF